MDRGQGSEKNSLEFRQIVLQHIQKILEISSVELRDRTSTKHHGNFSETIEQEDSRQSYIQAIENLSYVLIPYFDEKMQKVYDTCIKILSSFDFEILASLKEDYDKVCKSSGLEKISDVFIIQMKIRYAKKLFIALNQLLHRNDYLKTAVYGETADDVVEDEEVKEKKK